MNLGGLIIPKIVRQSLQTSLRDFLEISESYSRFQVINSVAIIGAIPIQVMSYLDTRHARCDLIKDNNEIIKQMLMFI